ncbi:hypothetical protein QN277_028573 [Acacia crassicarpa]|uniref:Uncharacterized protein n=1 Tax=Acacia crassicarpa TaxID=499986 RepID=A0AAE1K190_9FABA|nr:hypothetical protein QN277_028573 [Acacia crassicarpa]
MTATRIDLRPPLRVCSVFNTTVATRIISELRLKERQKEQDCVSSSPTTISMSRKRAFRFGFLSRKICELKAV